MSERDPISFYPDFLDPNMELPVSVVHVIALEENKYRAINDASIAAGATESERAAIMTMGHKHSLVAAREESLQLIRAAGPTIAEDSMIDHDEFLYNAKDLLYPEDVAENALRALVRSGLRETRPTHERIIHRSGTQKRPIDYRISLINLRSQLAELKNTPHFNSTYFNIASGLVEKTIGIPANNHVFDMPQWD